MICIYIYIRVHLCIDKPYISWVLPKRDLFIRCRLHRWDPGLQQIQGISPPVQPKLGVSYFWRSNQTCNEFYHIYIYI